LFLAVAKEWIVEREKISIWARLKGILPALAAFIGISIPYFQSEWRTLVAYFRIQMVSERHLWEFKLPLKDRLRFYLDGGPGQFMLGSYVYLCAGIILAGICVVAVKKMKAEAAFFATLLLVVAAAFTGPALNTQYALFAATHDAALF
jgi:hypothetical protein